MKVKNYSGTPIETIFAGKGKWKTAKDVTAWVDTDEGFLRYVVKAGFPTDMRSGAGVIDSIIPKFTGNNQYNLAILLHDVNYTSPAVVSKGVADTLLVEMTKVSKTLNAFQRGLVKTALKLFGWPAYDKDSSGAHLVSFSWGDK